MDLHQRIEDACNRLTLSMMRNVHAELLSRIQTCVVIIDEHFEHTKY